MDLESFKAMLETPEGKAVLDNHVKARVAEEYKGLLEKNDKLLREAKAAKEKVDEAERERAAAQEEAVMKSGDIEKITAKFKADIEKTAAEKAATEKMLHGLVVEEGLTKALVKAGVAPQYLDASKALLSQQGIEMVFDNGKPIATVGGKGLEDYVSEWAASDTGKHFVSAAANSGGGSGGANASTGGVGGEYKTSTQRIAAGLKKAQLNS